MVHQPPAQRPYADRPPCSEGLIDQRHAADRPPAERRHRGGRQPGRAGGRASARGCRPSPTASNSKSPRSSGRRVSVLTTGGSRCRSLMNVDTPDTIEGMVPEVPGLYFLGLPFQTSLSSSLLGGVGATPGVIARHLSRQPSKHRAVLPVISLGRRSPSSGGRLWVTDDAPVPGASSVLQPDRTRGPSRHPATGRATVSSRSRSPQDSRA